MRTPSDGEVYDPNDRAQAQCLKKAECYLDRTVDPPVIRLMKTGDDYEIVGWVWLTTYGQLKYHDVKVSPGEDGKYFMYKGKKFPPGVYYLIRRDGREFLVSEKTLKSW